MSEVRKQIRKQVILLLKGRTDAGSNVRENRGEVNWGENLPAINVYFRGEPAIAERDQSPRTMNRLLEMEIECLTFGQDGEEISDKLDDLSEQVERCLSVDDTLGGCADDILLSSVSEMEVETSGKKPFGKISLTFQVRYWTYNPRDTKGQGNFENLNDLNAHWNIQPGQAEADQASDVIDMTS